MRTGWGHTGDMQNEGIAIAIWPKEKLHGVRKMEEEMSKRGKKEEESRSRKNLRVEQQILFSGLIVPGQIIMLGNLKMSRWTSSGHTLVKMQKAPLCTFEMCSSKTVGRMQCKILIPGYRNKTVYYKRVFFSILISLKNLFYWFSN